MKLGAVIEEAKVGTEERSKDRAPALSNVQGWLNEEEPATESEEEQSQREKRTREMVAPQKPSHGSVSRRLERLYQMLLIESGRRGQNTRLHSSTLSDCFVPDVLQLSV